MNANQRMTFCGWLHAPRPVSVAPVFAPGHPLPAWQHPLALLLPVFLPLGGATRPEHIERKFKVSPLTGPMQAFGPKAGSGIQLMRERYCCAEGSPPLLQYRFFGEGEVPKQHGSRTRRFAFFPPQSSTRHGRATREACAILQSTN